MVDKLCPLSFSDIRINGLDCFLIYMKQGVFEGMDNGNCPFLLTNWYCFHQRFSININKSLLYGN